MEEAELLSDRVAIIDRGRITAVDTPRNLISRLDGMGHIEFAATRPIRPDELVRLPGVSGAEVNGGSELRGPVYRLKINDPRTAVTSLLGWSQGEGLDLLGLSVIPGTLEDVFLDMTGRELTE